MPSWINLRSAAGRLVLVILAAAMAGECLADDKPPNLQYNRSGEFSIVDMNTEVQLIFRVEYNDVSGIDVDSVRIIINGQDRTADAVVTTKHVELVIKSPDPGMYTAKVVVGDKVSNLSSVIWDVMYQAC